MRASDLPSLHTFITNGYRLRTEIATSISAVERYRNTARVEPASAAKLKTLLTAAITALDAGIIPAVTSVTVDPATGSGAVDSTVQLTATVAPVGVKNKDVIWTSATPATATVSATGLVTLVAAGTVVITARSAADASKTGTATITVTDE